MKDFDALSARVGSKRDQQMEFAVAWLWQQMQIPHVEGQRRITQVISEYVSDKPVEEMAALPKDVLQLIQRFAWLGLTDAVAICSERIKQKSEG